MKYRIRPQLLSLLFFSAAVVAALLGLLFPMAAKWYLGIVGAAVIGIVSCALVGGNADGGRDDSP